MRKSEIESLLVQKNVMEAEKAILEYERINPNDLDLFMMKTSLALIKGDLEKAFLYSKEGVERLPLNGDMQYNYAVVCEAKGMMAEAYEAYYRAYFIYQYTKDEKKDELNILASATKLLHYVDSEIEHMSREQAESAVEMIRGLMAMQDKGFGLDISEFRSPDFPQIVGKYYYEDRSVKRYAGIFKDQYFCGEDIEKGNLDVMHLKTEFLLSDDGTTKMLGNDAEEFFLPIASESENTIHKFINNMFTVKTRQVPSKRFTYYRLPAETKVESSSLSYYGNPVPICHEPKRKKLIMSIFVDGLSFNILRDEGLHKIMPNMERFFEKGLVFTEAYNTSEWTYPSIINYISGLDTTHHMLFHHTLDYPLTKQISTIAELFHGAGYYTAMFNGNWRIIPPYGHARGYDRFVYQHQKIGFKVQEVIADVINHIEAFREVDQYIWLSIGDLHDVADKEVNPVYVQERLKPEFLGDAEGGGTSVKQSYDESNIAAYKQTASYIDFWLGILFQYIQNNYAENEFVISLFSDHGQGYLIKDENAHFLSEERSNIPMFFRGGSVESIGYCDELVSSSDYLTIMSRLTDVFDKDINKRDGRLPHILGGEEGRDYTITESIHPGDPYQAAVFTRQQGPVLYFVNPVPVGDDGRFKLGKYDCYMKERNGQNVIDDKEKERYLEIVLKHIAPLLIYE